MAPSGPPRLLAGGLVCSALRTLGAVPVFVMMPLETMSRSGTINDPEGITWMLQHLKAADADGVMVDVWWGATEPEPARYNFHGYRHLFGIAKSLGLKLQLVASFHQCGGNLGDECNITLPPFVHQAKDIWYKDVNGNENKEYVSLFADNVSVAGRTTLQMYSDWLGALVDAFRGDMGVDGPIVEVQVGLGPAGELRYPSYPLKHWKYCGIGEFQAYDEHALASLRRAAQREGLGLGAARPPPPSDVGDYNSRPARTRFFKEADLYHARGFVSPSGHFFLEWYSSALVEHAVQVLSRARAVVPTQVRISGKIAGIHWWYDTWSHPAELTAGYYNSFGQSGYNKIAKGFVASGNASMVFTCLEMQSQDQLPECKSDPERLVGEVIQAAKANGLDFLGENALGNVMADGFEHILGYRTKTTSFTYLRLSRTLLLSESLHMFTHFVSAMHNGVPWETPEITSLSQLPWWAWAMQLGTAVICLAVGWGLGVVCFGGKRPKNFRISPHESSSDSDSASDVS